MKYLACVLVVIASAIPTLAWAVIPVGTYRVRVEEAVPGTPEVVVEEMGAAHTFVLVYRGPSPVPASAVGSVLVFKPSSSQAASTPSVLIKDMRHGNYHLIQGSNANPRNFSGFTTIGRGPTDGQLIAVYPWTNQIVTIDATSTNNLYAPFATNAVPISKYGQILFLDQPTPNRVVAVTHSHLLVLDTNPALPPNSPSSIVLEWDIRSVLQTYSTIGSVQPEVQKVISNGQAAYLFVEDAHASTGHMAFLVRYDLNSTSLGPTLPVLGFGASRGADVDLLAVEPTGRAHLKVGQEYWTYGPQGSAFIPQDLTAFLGDDSIHFPNPRGASAINPSTPLAQVAHGIGSSQPNPHSPSTTSPPIASRATWSGRNPRIDPLHPDEFEAQIRRQDKEAGHDSFPDQLTLADFFRRIAHLGALQHFGILLPAEQRTLGIRASGGGLIPQIELLPGRERDTVTLQQVTQILSIAALRSNHSLICASSLSKNQP